MNTKHPYYKEKLKLEREIGELELAQNKNCVWVPLEKPYRHGYTKTFDLRVDIKNRFDAWVFYKCLSLIAKPVWCRDKNFRRKLRKGTYEIIKPGRKYISAKVYDNLHAMVKKHFVEVKYYDKDYSLWKKEYLCTLPPYYFIEKIKTNWITQEYITDISNKSAIAEKQDTFWKSELYRIKFGGGSAPKSYRRPFNRSDKNYNKKTLNRNITSGDFDKYQYRYSHRHGASWFYW